MAVTQRVFVLLALFLASSCIAEARDILQFHHRDRCPGEPPEGDWFVNHNFPSGPENNTLVFQIQTVMTLQKVLDNVYQGSALGEVVNAQFPTLTDGQPVAYAFNGIWDQDTCSMSGVVLNFGELIADPAKLVWDGETLTGPYLNTGNGTILFSRTGMLNMVPVEGS